MNKKLSRRQWFRALAGPLPLLPVMPSVLAQEPAAGEAGASLEALGPFLDTLLPEDGEFPSATALGIDTAMIAQGVNLAIIRLGCGWLDRQAREEGAAGFAVLGEEARIRIVARAEASGTSSLAREFFRLALVMAYRHYYSKQESWAALDYDGPPQPRGFMDFDKPPGDNGA